ncbi:hypothetical protein A0O28_0027980 [Trichoderma guizhouense]|uniref:Uncharacterized protein n=1 Tax=Trichoderma guizhouense TaxID=1491466 RepID=A0A1T3CTS0_9HYPO|nr:hypothetical protein A0O28_0027980 [Trichoderma guizhouense]
MLDERHGDLPKPLHDGNTYTLGSISGHNVLIACLPKGRYGTNSATNVATLMIRTFPFLKVCLMVGIGGGVPPKVRLGDVVVSTPDGQHPGVVQWDMGKAKIEGFERIGVLNNPPNSLLSALNKVETEHKLVGSKIPEYLAQAAQKYPTAATRYLKSDSLKDMLFQANCVHVNELKVGKDAYNGSMDGANKTKADKEQESDGDDSEEKERDGCRLCDKTALVKRKPRSMRVHYGLIASGNQVIKDATFRDKLNQTLGGEVLCFEMEAAGLMNNFPCLVIRGICDYSDSHKNKAWQEHAAAVAAAFAKELLYHVQLSDVKGERPAVAILNKVEQDIQHMHQMVRDGFVQTQNDLNCLLDENKMKKQNKIMNWLSPIDFAAQHYDFITKCEPGSGQSILTSGEFMRWIKEKNTTLFCSGIPGSGKTFQMSILVSHLLHQFQDDQTTSVVYLYFDYKRQQHEQKTEHVIANLVKQLCLKLMRRGFPPEVEELYNRHEERMTRPLIKELSEVLVSLIKSFSRIFIIIDALDECEDNDGSRTRLLNQLFSLQEETHLNLFATSRPIPSITKRFQKCLLREIIPSHNDVTLFLGNYMSQLPSFVTGDIELQVEIKTSIVSAIDGIFLLARLYIDSLVGKRSPAALRLALKKLRENSGNGLIPLYKAYDEAIERIQHQKGDLPYDALLILSWVDKARKQLTIQELQEALAVQVATSALDKDNIPTIDHITQACAPLVVVDRESKIIRLAHYTLQEYFENPDNTLLGEAHVTITNICMTYLSFSAFQSGPLELKDLDDPLGDEVTENHLYSYAARHWGYHTHKALGQGLDPLKVVSFLEHVQQDSWYQSLLHRHMIDLYDMPLISLLKDYTACHLTPLHLASCFGLCNVVDLLITKGYDTNAEDSLLRTPLWWAARNGHAPVVKRLLESDVELESKDDLYCQTALSVAAEHGHELIVQLLADKGADLESQGGIDASPSFAVLEMHSRKMDQWAAEAYGEPFNLETLRLTPLAWAAMNGHTATIRILIKKGANIETKDHKGFTPLMWAVMNGHKGTIELLIANDAYIMAKDNDGRTLFGHADETILEILFAKATNLKVEDEAGRTPLAWAAATKNIMLASFLLKRDVDIEARDHIGMTPFFSGVITGNTVILELLLTYNASLETRDDCNQTPLIGMAITGDGPMIKFLLSKNADMEAKCHEGLTPLARAVLSNHYEAAKILVDNGANVNHQVSRGQTILHVAAAKASWNIASLLLESATIDFNPMDDIGRSPLSYAAKFGNYDVVKALLTTGKVDIESTDELSRTPMWYAKNEAKDERLVQLLLSYGAKELDDDYFTNGSSERYESVKRRLSNETSDSPPFKRRC